MARLSGVPLNREGTLIAETYLIEIDVLGGVGVSVGGGIINDDVHGNILFYP